MARKAFDFETLLNETPEQVNTPGAQTTMGGSTQYVSKKTGKVYGKHNFMFDNDTWEKLRMLQRRLGMPQHELLEIIVARYVAEFEAKNGALSNENIILV